MAKREIGMKPLEPITLGVAVQKIVQTLERLGSQGDQIRALEDAGNRVMPGFRVDRLITFQILNGRPQEVRK
jgi:hypothetical protein